MTYKYRMYLFLHYTVRGVLVSVFRLLNTLHMKCVFVKTPQPNTNLHFNLCSYLPVPVAPSQSSG